MKWKRFSILVLFILAGSLVYGQYGIQGFDISPDGRSIIFALTYQGRSTVHILDIENKTAKRLLAAEPGYTFSKPHFFGSAAFTIIKSKDSNAQVFLASMDGKAPEEIATGELITEAAGLEGRHEVYFFKANEFTKYSSIAQKAPHNMDLYSIDLGSRAFKRLTYLKAYRLFDMSVTRPGELFFRWENADSSGIYSLQAGNCCLLKKFRPKNPEEKLVYHVALTDDHKKFFFSAMYFIYRYDGRNNTGIQLYSSPDPITRLVVHPQKDELIFSTQLDNRLFFLDFDGHPTDTVDCSRIVGN